MCRYLAHPALAMTLALGMAGCGDSDKTDQAGEHVWKEQTQTIERAEGVETLLQESAKAQQRALEAQTNP